MATKVCCRIVRLIKKPDIWCLYQRVYIKNGGQNGHFERFSNNDVNLNTGQKKSDRFNFKMANAILNPDWLEWFSDVSRIWIFTESYHLNTGHLIQFTRHFLNSDYFISIQDPDIPGLNPIKAKTNKNCFLLKFSVFRKFFPIKIIRQNFWKTEKYSEKS